MSEQKPIETATSLGQTAPMLWSRGGFVDDVWQALADSDGVPASGSLIVSLPRWLDQRHALLAGTGNGRRYGVRVGHDAAIDQERDVIGGLDLIALHFPKFTDGRAYSTARRLRQQLGYAGELRASGDVLFDQLPLMLACGFDTFEITDTATRRQLHRQSGRGTLQSYQHRLQGGRNGRIEDFQHDGRQDPAQCHQPERMRWLHRDTMQAAGSFAAE